jgi:flagellar biosynthesis protein FlhA
MMLAVDPGLATITLEGEQTREPAYNLPAVWIPVTDKPRAEMSGYNVVDASDVLINHLAEVIRRHASELLSREDLKTLIDKVKETSPAVVEELIPGLLPMGTVHRVMTLLLEERVPITNMTRILESLASNAGQMKDAGELNERVRLDIGRAICDRFRDENGVVRAMSIDAMLDEEFRTATRTQPPKIDPTRLKALVNKIELEKVKANAQGREICLVVDIGLRRIFRAILTKAIPDLSVLSYQEIPIDVPMQVDVLIGANDLNKR